LFFPPVGLCFSAELRSFQLPQGKRAINSGALYEEQPILRLDCDSVLSAGNGQTERLDRTDNLILLENTY